MNRMLWALLSYPLSLAVPFMGLLFPEEHRESMQGFRFFIALFLVWIILAVWFGISYFKSLLSGYKSNSSNWL